VTEEATSSVNTTEVMGWFRPSPRTAQWFSLRPNRKIREVSRPKKTCRMTPAP